MQYGLVLALRARHADVVTALECRMINRSDEDHLRFAAQQERALYSFNIADYYHLHSRWSREGLADAGIILAPQKRYSVGEQARRLLRLAQARPYGMERHLEYLSVWG